MKLTIFSKYCALSILLFFTCACSGTSLSEYRPKTQNESEIISLLFKYQDARNRLDHIQLLTCLHDQGEYNFGRGQMVSKEKLKELLPELWAELKFGSPAAYEIGWESRNGNNFPQGEFFIPKIVVNGNTANITVMFTHSFWKQKHYIIMIKEKAQWLITRLEWDYG